MCLVKEEAREEERGLLWGYEKNPERCNDTKIIV
jgi:hypothetical protein